MTFDWTKCVAALALAGGMALASAPALAAGAGPNIEKQDWSFAGVFGHYDRAQLQRGFQVYKEVCSACHGMRLLSYRNLSQTGGPEFSEDQVKAISADYITIDGPDEDGEMFERAALPKDRFASPYRNVQESRAANGGAYPPDLSLIAKARNAYQETSFGPMKWATDIVTGYQEGGPDYIYALLTGYPEDGEAPEGFELGDGMNYNAAYPGHQIAMAQPIYEDGVEYRDGTSATVSQQSKDVAAFLMWAAEPTLEERKRLGIRVMLYLIILSVLLYLAKRSVWARLHH